MKSLKDFNYLLSLDRRYTKTESEIFRPQGGFFEDSGPRCEDYFSRRGLFFEQAVDARPEAGFFVKVEIQPDLQCKVAGT